LWGIFIKSLTLRDQKLLNGLLEYGLLSTKQIQRLYFSSGKDGKIDRRTVLRRLRKLAKLRWIVRHKTSSGGEIIWTLGLKGSKLLASDFYLKGINRASLYHDLTVSDMRINLEHLKVCSHWKSSHLLRYRINLKKNPYLREPDSIPDWLFSMKLKSRPVTVAMEVELNFKGSRRQSKVFEMYSNKKIDHIWYIVPNIRFGQKVLKVLREFGRNKSTWVFFSTIDDIKSDPKMAKVFYLGGQTTLEKLCGFDAHPPAHTVGNNELLQSRLSA
jgi:hypothetical protein